MKTIVDFFKNSPRKQDPDPELLRALELSKKEFMKEQKRHLNIPEKQKKRKRIVQPADDDEDDWFQTVSSRHQLPKKHVKVKKELPPEEPPLVIENLSEWFEVKEEKANEKAYEIPDLSAFLDQDNDEDDSRPGQESFECSICKNVFTTQREWDDHESNCSLTIISDDDEEEQQVVMEEEEEQQVILEEDEEIDNSDCSVIDLVNNVYPTIQDSDDNATMVVEDENQEEEDDGYLSPLEGFTNINENRSEYNAYFEQLQQPTPVKRTRAASTGRSRGGRGRGGRSRGGRGRGGSRAPKTNYYNNRRRYGTKKKN